MTAEITWKIENLEREAATGVVTVAHWRVIARQDNVLADAYGSVPLGAPAEAVIPFELLTQEQVLYWVKERLPVDEIETKLQAHLATLLAPKTVPGLPWA